MIEKEWSENRVLIKIVKKMRKTLIPNLQTVERVFFNGPTADWDKIYQINSDDFATKMKEAKLWEEDWEIFPRVTFDLKLLLEYVFPDIFCRTYCVVWGMNDFIENTEMRPADKDPEHETKYSWECPEILNPGPGMDLIADNLYKEYFFKYGERSVNDSYQNTTEKSDMKHTHKKSTGRRGPKYKMMLIHRTVYPNKILKICCGFDFTIFLTDEGSVWAWGDGAAGCLGQLSSDD